MMLVANITQILQICLSGCLLSCHILLQSVTPTLLCIACAAWPTSYFATKTKLPSLTAITQSDTVTVTLKHFQRVNGLRLLSPKVDVPPAALCCSYTIFCYSQTTVTIHFVTSRLQCALATLHCARKSPCDTKQTVRLMHTGAGYQPLGGQKGFWPYLLYEGLV